MNNRRKLVIALGAGAISVPFGSYAQQQGKVWRIGFLSPRRPDNLATDVYGGFQRGMRELGYIEGKNLVIEWRYADGVLDRLSDLAAELVRLQVDVIVTAGTLAASAAQKATSTIPIVMANVGDPVAAGLVKSLARPGENITGLSNFTADMNSKRLEMLLSMAPKQARVVYLINPDNPQNVLGFKNIEAAGQKHGITVLLAEARTPQEIDKAFASFRQQNVGALFVALDAIFQQQRNRIAKLAAKYRWPSISADSMYAEAGGLITYGTNQADLFRRAATYVDRILKGAKPADLPVEQPTKFELIINGKTARALGLTIPQSLLIMANKVIQ